MLATSKGKINQSLLPQDCICQELLKLGNSSFVLSQGCVFNKVAVTLRGKKCMVILSDSNEYMKGEGRQIIPPAVSYITFLGGGASTLHIKRQHQSHKANVLFLKTVINT